MHRYSKLTLQLLARETLMLLQQERMTVPQLLTKWDAFVDISFPRSAFYTTIEYVAERYLLPAVCTVLTAVPLRQSTLPLVVNMDNSVAWSIETYRGCRVAITYSPMTEVLTIRIHKYESYPLRAEHLYHWLGSLAEAA